VEGADIERLEDAVFEKDSIGRWSNLFRNNITGDDLLYNS